MNLRPSHIAVELTASFEGFEERAYLDSVRVPTIGYGSTRWFDVLGQPKVKMGETITHERAEGLLLSTLESFWSQVVDHIEVNLEQYHVDALACFIYNIGVTAFLKSTMLKMINGGDFEGAERQFLRWDKAGGKVLRGLTRRRVAEAKLFSGNFE